MDDDCSPHCKTPVESSRGMCADLDYSKYPLGRRRDVVVGPVLLTASACINFQGNPVVNTCDTGTKRHTNAMYLLKN